VFVVRDCIHIKAPIERCFLLSTNIELMQRTVRMRIAQRGSSRCSGLALAGDRIVWRGWWFGLPLQHESIVTAYESPNYVRETVEHGRFRRFEHDLRLTEIDGHVLLTGSVRFSLPFGAAGRWAARRTFLPRVMELLRQRLHLLRLVAESEHWPQYLEQKR
jgi:hypothetical protein